MKEGGRILLLIEALPSGVGLLTVGIPTFEFGLKLIPKISPYCKLKLPLELTQGLVGQTVGYDGEIGFLFWLRGPKLVCFSNISSLEAHNSKAACPRTRCVACLALLRVYLLPRASRLGAVARPMRVSLLP